MNDTLCSSLCVSSYSSGRIGSLNDLLFLRAIRRRMFSARFLLPLMNSHRVDSGTKLLKGNVSDNYKSFDYNIYIKLKYWVYFQMNACLEYNDLIVISYFHGIKILVTFCKKEIKWLVKPGIDLDFSSLE